MKVVYVAGPFRSYNWKGEIDVWEVQQNINRAMGLALEVWRAGAAAICPHGNTSPFQGAAPDDVWLAGDLAILAKADAILMTLDWEHSSGARAEREFALARSIPVFYDLEALRTWLAQLAPSAAA